MPIPFGSVVPEGETMPRPVKVEEWVCPTCKSVDARDVSEAFEKAMLVCNKCGFAFYPSDSKPWLRPDEKRRVRGEDCCRCVFTKYCAFHDSASYTQTKSGEWYYKPRKPSAEEVAAHEKSFQDTLDVTRRAAESVKKLTNSVKNIGEAVVKAGDACADYGSEMRALLAERQEKKPGGLPTGDGGWSGEVQPAQRQAVPIWGKVLMLMIATAVVAYFVDWGLDWLRSL